MTFWEAAFGIVFSVSACVAGYGYGQAIYTVAFAPLVRALGG